MIVAPEWLFPVTSPPLHRHALEVENGLISAVRPLRDSDPFVPGTALLPGLINAHTHLAYTALRNRFDHLEFFPWIRALTQFKKQMTAEEIAASARLGINECLRAGITTVADMCDMEPALAALAHSPLRGIFYIEVFGVEQDMAEGSWRELQKRYPLLKEQYSSSRLQIGISPHTCYTVRPELYRRIADWAIHDQIPISFHLSESKAEEDFIGKRSGPIFEALQQRTADWVVSANTATSHLETTGIFDAKPLLAHLVRASPDDIRILQKYDVTVAHCPKSNAKFGHGVAPAADLIRNGFRVGLGTDSAASNNRLDLFEEARFGLLQQRNRYGSGVLSETEMLEMMTIRGAAALRMDHRIGSLEKGKEADMALLRLPSCYATGGQVLSHVIHNSVASDVLKTYIRGQEISTEDATPDLASLYGRP
jgi:5-methylthioadenosine/S-adenosylhomocysteine deaminase